MIFVDLMRLCCGPSEGEGAFKSCEDVGAETASQVPYFHGRIMLYGGLLLLKLLLGWHEVRQSDGKLLQER